MASAPLFDEIRRDPYRVYADLRRRGPVLRVPETNAWMILDYPSVRQALTDFEQFSSDIPAARGSRFDWLLSMDPPRHERLRAILVRAFTPSWIAALEARVRGISARLLDGPLSRGQMDVVRDFAEPLPLMMFGEMLGLTVEDLPRIRRWNEAIVSMMEVVLGTEPEVPGIADAFKSTNAELAEEIVRLLAARRTEPRNDLLTALALAEVDGRSLCGEEVVRFLQLVLAAGTKTTTNLIANAVVCLVDNAAERERLRAAPGLLGTAVEEVLRYRAPVQAAFRIARQRTEVGGERIERGDLVLLMLGAANRDPARFPDAERFDVGRDPNPHLGFGHGIHACLGGLLARLQARVALSDLLARLPAFRRAAALADEPSRAFYFHGPQRLPIIFDR